MDCRVKPGNDTEPIIRKPYDMTQMSIVPVERLELTFTPQPWPFAETRRAEIEAHFDALKAAKPALWNGQVLALHEHRFEGSVFRGSFLAADYASFLAWRDWGYPETGVKDSFAQGALLTADGAFLLGVMGQHTANAGRIYFPSGIPDPSDVNGSTVDFEASVRREVWEETGLTPADYVEAPAWHTVLGGPYVAQFRILRLRQDAVSLRARILDFLARERQPELSDIRIVRGPADLDEQMPAYVAAFLTHAWDTSAVSACG
jgi:8-oxo-dGTP pyrophosphatase MutT (NUDIX family)